MKKILVVTFLMLSVLFAHAQETRQSESWKKYATRTQIELGVLNLSYAVFMTSKQFYIPVKTQRWLVPAVTVPVMGFTLYKTIEYHKRRPVVKRVNYKGYD